MVGQMSAGDSVVAKGRLVLLDIRIPWDTLIQVRVDRLVHGNPGQHRVLSGGVCEMKIDVGPGYRVYYTERGGVVIVLPAGGDKSSQAKDIRLATALAKNL